MFNAIYAKYVCLYLSREKERNCRFFLTKSILAILAVILIWIPMNESNNGSTIQHDDDDISIYKLLTKNSHSTASKKKSYHEWIETIKLYHIIFFLFDVQGHHHLFRFDRYQSLSLPLSITFSYSLLGSIYDPKIYLFFLLLKQKKKKIVNQWY